MSRILVLTGLPGSGKSVASEIAVIMGIPVITMGDVIRAETAKRGLEPNGDNIGKVAVDLRKEFGDDIVLRRLWPEIHDAINKNPLVIIDGMRSTPEKEALVELMGEEPDILAIIASENTRNSRLRGRGRSDDEGTATRDTRERSWGVEALISEANHRIQNEYDINSFREEVKVLLEGLGRGD
mgnify:FL=1